ncbi:carboxypeptidase-like regulatory domain-containing protein [Adhaeribacter soli]|uniref:Carboxypeptidase-like regulatory domain-containing protein n=1 Tax=Adhaeribacter soli TaxID=2607655 RepID=A0A5N1J302_9BACT|nr:carboxypeptidase-like regulatory domain-containing protein [Adhaeribacter soli]KAA9340896.1 hypothetical protein F0P94_05550 [Adhaeribacter soli]
MLRFLVCICFLVMAGQGFGQTQKPAVTISGRVVADSTLAPLQGVSIVARPSRFGTISQANGAFQLKANPGDTLVFSSVGFENGRYVVTQSPNQVIKVVLKEKSTLLKEVEVSTRPSAEKINRALRNMKRPPEPDPIKAPPPAKPLIAEKPTVEIKPAAFSNPASFLYEKYSREGKERQKMEEIQQAKKDSASRKKEAEYDKLFLDRNKPFK